MPQVQSDLWITNYIRFVSKVTLPLAMKVEQVIHARCPDPKKVNEYTDWVVVRPLEERINIYVLPF